MYAYPSSYLNKAYASLHHRSFIKKATEIFGEYYKMMVEEPLGISTSLNVNTSRHESWAADRPLKEKEIYPPSISH
jgi:hypothetical protein